jgi:hypothetical protein
MISLETSCLLIVMDRRQIEEEALLHDRKLFPVQMYNAQGVLQYDMSATKASLREDVAAGRHLTMTAAALKAMQPEFIKSTVSISSKKSSTKSLLTISRQAREGGE